MKRGLEECENAIKRSPVLIPKASQHDEFCICLSSSVTTVSDKKQKGEKPSKASTQSPATSEGQEAQGSGKPKRYSSRRQRATQQPPLPVAETIPEQMATPAGAENSYYEEIGRGHCTQIVHRKNSSRCGSVAAFRSLSSDRCSSSIVFRVRLFYCLVCLACCFVNQ